MKLRIHKPSPALAIACLSLFVALSGASYAVVKLPRNSVGTPQLKRNAVISTKVRNFSLQARDFAPGQLPQGAQGPAGTNGAPGPPGPGARWALVAGNGTIVRQSGGVAVTGPGSIATTTFHVDFGTATAGKAFLVSVHPGGGATRATVAPCVPSGAQFDTVICDPDISTGAGNDVEVTVDTMTSPTAPLFYVAMLP